VELIPFIHFVLRRWWLLVLLGTLGVVCALALSTAAPRHYQSTVSMQLNPSAKSAFLPFNSADSAVANPVSALAASYSEVLRSRAFGEVVVARLQLPVDPDVLVRAIGAKLVPNTSILRVSVTWDNPQDAQHLAQSIAEIFIAENLQRQQAQPGAQLRTSELEESARQMQTRLVALRQQRDRLDQVASRGDLSRLGELNDLDTRLGALETSYANLLVEINRARSSLDTAAILDSASAAQPIGALSTVQAVLLGLALGLAAGAGLGLLLERLVGAIRDPVDLAAVSGAAPLALIGHVPATKGKQEGVDRRLVAVGAPQSPLTEAFRTLRTNLRVASFEHPLHVLAVTSVGAGDGKTFVCANLAVVLAQLGKRVLLVDADLRHPTAHQLFGLDNRVGLVDGLRTEALAATGAANVVPSGVKNLWLLPSGPVPPDPSELLGSDAAGRLIRRLAQLWDIVVLDSPPVGPVADALVLAEHADGLLVVARSGQTRRSDLRGALEALRNVGRPLLGVVLNDLRPGPLARYSPYGRYYAGYHTHYAGEAGAEPRGDARAAAVPTTDSRSAERLVGAGQD
jgi:non-specific protein-tyrosine kinase